MTTDLCFNVIHIYRLKDEGSRDLGINRLLNVLES